MPPSTTTLKNLLAAVALSTPAVAQAQAPVAPTAPAAPVEIQQAADHLSGAFIQLNETTASASADWWHAEFAAMKALGMDTAIVQYTGYDNHYYYPTKIQDAQSNDVDAIARILDAADQTTLRVFLGLQLHSAFWDNQFDGDDNLQRNLTLLNELRQRYGNHAALAGWYIPEEISDHTPRNAEQSAALLQYIGAITQVMHETTDLPVMISPYFGQEPDAAAYAQWWDTVALPAIHIDIFALQDGVGTHRTTTAQARPVFEALAPVMKRHGVAFWANNESFDQTHDWPVDDQPWDSRPVACDTFISQIQSTAPLVEKIVTFEFTQYLSPQKPGPSRDLYEAYDRHRRAATPATPVKKQKPTATIPAGSQP